MQQKVAELSALREEVMERLVTAREMGDLSENGAYKYAKFELGNIGRQLKRLQHLLEVGYPVEKSTAQSSTVDFGSTVTVQKVGTQDSKTFTVVSKHESDPSKDLLAFTSPMGKAVMHKTVGDTVTLTTPRGDVSYRITSII